MSTTIKIQREGTGVATQLTLTGLGGNDWSFSLVTPGGDSVEAGRINAWDPKRPFEELVGYVLHTIAEERKRVAWTEQRKRDADALRDQSILNYNADVKAALSRCWGDVSRSDETAAYRHHSQTCPACDAVAVMLYPSTGYDHLQHTGGCGAECLECGAMFLWYESSGV